MSTKKLNIIVGITALTLGALIYIIFRPNTFVAKIFSHFEIVSGIQENLNFLSCNFIRFYLPDYLWCLSFCSLFIGFTNINKYYGAIFSFAFGLIWEILQFVKIVSGTGDFFDILAYLVAALTILIINIKEKKK